MPRLTALLQRSVYLHLARHGNTWRMSHSEDRKKWRDLESQWEEKLPRKLKVGVFAKADVEGKFTVVFDHFKLSRPAK